MDHIYIWDKTKSVLKGRLPAHAFETWFEPIKPLNINGTKLVLQVPNQFFSEWVDMHYRKHIVSTLEKLGAGPREIKYVISTDATNQLEKTNSNITVQNKPKKTPPPYLSSSYTFSAFIEGPNNQFAKAAAQTVAKSPGKQSFNPLVIYGGVGLGKTHLLHSIGNEIITTAPKLKVVIASSEKFTLDFISSIQKNRTAEFSKSYRNANVLLIDDIQFFAGKERSQEEFFHTFNALLEGQRQIVLTCDRYPKEVNGLEERLKSRFGWGLTVSIEPPELETSVAILKAKAVTEGVELPDEVAFFIAKRIRSNVRELEGALRRVIANSTFTGRPISLIFAKEALRDLLAVQDRLVSVENIQKTVADYFKIRVAELLSKRRSRSVARPRQIAMALAKELTNHSLPEIGDAFGGRDHTTVLHACRRIAALRETEKRVDEDYVNLLRTLTG